MIVSPFNRIRCTSALSRMRAAVELTPPADSWYHLAPFGEFKGTVTVDGEEQDCLHLFDAEAFAQILAAFKSHAQKMRAEDPAWKGLNVDADHLSARLDNKTERFAFITDLEVRGDGAQKEDGLWCKLALTTLGEPAVRGGIYSFLSGVFDNVKVSEGVWRPVALAGTVAHRPGGEGNGQPENEAAAGFTNDPALPVRAFCRADHFARQFPTSSARAGAEEKTNPATSAGKEQKQVTPEQLRAALCSLLGLDAKCSDQELQAAIDTAGSDMPASMERMKQACRTHENRIAELEHGQEADTFCDQHKDKIVDRAKFRAFYLKNPEDAKAFIGAVKAPEAKPLRTLHRTPTKTPDVDAATVTDARSLATQQRAFVNQVKRDTGLTGTAAFRHARSLKPELFATTSEAE